MPNVKIKFKFNKNLDFKMAWEFYSHPEFAGNNFWQERALSHHPRLCQIKNSKNKKSFLKKYISDFYDSHRKEIIFLSEKTEKFCAEKQDAFFFETAKIFKNYPWPKKKFIGFFSIFDFCPRFLEDGSFQVFIYDSKNLQLFTIFHEMLHFIFYNYAKNNFPNEFKKMDTEKGKFWDLAEIFNTAIQNSNSFVKIHGKIKNIGYKEHKKLIPLAEKLWNEKKDIDFWIEKMLEKI
ncbi:MAG: hypothetical protein PHZ25_02650 [Candidatus Pacebacteria bacterium]|nr:hypothetical protein [Candidatus Paceibacterota bacterium]